LREALQPPPTQEQKKVRDKRLARQAGLPAAPKGPSAAMRFGRGIFGWVLFVGLAVMLYLLLDKNRRPGLLRPPTNNAAPIDLWLSVLPSALGAAGAGAFILTITLFNYLAKRRNHTQAPQLATRVMSGGLMVSLALVALSVWVMIHPPFEINYRPERFEVAFAAAAPWVIVFFMMWGLFRLAAKRGTQTMYDTNPTFRREHTLRIDAQGMLGDDGVMRTLYRWAAFTRAWETENLVVLDDEGNRRHMIPKRALLAAGELEPARALIVSHVPAADLFFTPGAFPVNRAPSAPIPAIPLAPAIPLPSPQGTHDHGDRI
jgi:hypothetical protein